MQNKERAKHLIQQERAIWKQVQNLFPGRAKLMRLSGFLEIMAVLCILAGIGINLAPLESFPAEYRHLVTRSACVLVLLSLIMWFWAIGRASLSCEEDMRKLSALSDLPLSVRTIALNQYVETGKVSFVWLRTALRNAMLDQEQELRKRYAEVLRVDAIING